MANIGYELSHVAVAPGSPEEARRCRVVLSMAKYRNRAQLFKAAIAFGRWREILRLYAYTEALRKEVQLRQTLLDDCRMAYLKDVWSIKRALTGYGDDDGGGGGGSASENAGGADAAGGGQPKIVGLRTIPEDIRALPTIDLRPWGGPPPKHRDQFEDLER